MADNKLILLRHLELTALRCSADVNNKISELTTAIAKDLTELDNDKQDKITGTAGQIIGFDSENNPVAMDERVHQSDWNQIDESAPDYVKNRPFGIIEKGPESITWDCDDKDGRESADVFRMGVLHYKVSDTTPSVECIIGGKLTVETSDGNSNAVDITSDAVNNTDSICNIANGTVFIVREVTADAPFFSSTGVYMMDYKALEELMGGVSLDGISVTLILDFGDIYNKIDEKYIPELPYVTEDQMNTAIDTKLASYSSLPEVTASDNGKFLRVVGGVWAAGTVLNAEEVGF